MTNLTEKLDELAIQLATQHGAMMARLNELLAPLNQIKTNTDILPAIKTGTDNLAGIKTDTANLALIYTRLAPVSALTAIQTGTDNLALIYTRLAPVSNLTGIKTDTANLALIYTRLAPVSALTAIQTATTGTQTATQTALTRFDTAQTTRLSLLATLSGIATDTLQMPALLTTIADCSCADDTPPAICAGYGSSISATSNRQGTFNVRTTGGSGGGGGYAVSYMLQFAPTAAFSTTLLARQYTGTPAYTFDISGITNPGVICATDGNPMKFVNTFPFEVYLFTAQQGASSWFRKAIASGGSHIVGNTTNDMIFCVGCNVAPPLAQETTVTVCYGLGSICDTGTVQKTIPTWAMVDVLMPDASILSDQFLIDASFTSSITVGSSTYTATGGEKIFYSPPNDRAAKNAATRSIYLYKWENQSISTQLCGVGFCQPFEEFESVNTFSFSIDASIVATANDKIQIIG